MTSRVVIASSGLLLALWMGIPGGASGADEDLGGAVSVDGARSFDRSPALSDLMRVPQGYGADSDVAVAGTTEARWRSRFRSTLGRLTAARKELAATKRELDGVAGQGGASQWSVAPPTGGAPPASSPLSFKLRQALKERRAELETAERALRELRIEADLAGVPQAWRGDEDVELGTEAARELAPLR